MGSLHDLLESPERGGYLYKYIKDTWKNKIVSKKTALKYGTYKIGTRSKQDYNISFENKTNAFFRLRKESRKGDKRAKEALVANSLIMYAKKLEELSSTFSTKSGREYKGRLVGKFVVEREISYKDKKTGNVISYLQRRSLKYGKVVKF
jgi:hypothetical protein